MLFESDHVRVTVAAGTATLALGFPGDPVNALDLARLRELDAGLIAVERNPFVNILVVRSATPAGFCAGVHPAALASLTTAADRAGFAWAGQRVFDRLASLAATTVAFIDGPCLGAGLELALACDHRLVVCRPTTHLGFPDAADVPPCFGGTVRLGRRAKSLLTSGDTISGREAQALGLVDDAFSERRGKIELRSFLDALERRGPRPHRLRELTGFAAERQAFAAVTQSPAAEPLRIDTVNPIPPFPAVIGLIGENDHAERIAAEAALRGSEVVVAGDAAGVFAGIAVALARGFVTPLEAKQVRGRVKTAPTGFDRAGLVFVGEGATSDEVAGSVRPRCVVAVCGGNPSPKKGGEQDEEASPPRFGSTPPSLPGQGVGGLGSSLTLAFGPAQSLALRPHAHTTPDTLAAVAAWLRAFGFVPTLAARPPAVARLAA